MHSLENLRGLQGLPKLEKLSLDSCSSLENEDFSILGSLSSLTALQVSGFDFGPTAVENIAHVPCMYSFYHFFCIRVEEYMAGILMLNNLQ